MLSLIFICCSLVAVHATPNPGSTSLLVAAAYQGNIGNVSVATQICQQNFSSQCSAVFPFLSYTNQPLLGLNLPFDQPVYSYSGQIMSTKFNSAFLSVNLANYGYPPYLSGYDANGNPTSNCLNWQTINCNITASAGWETLSDYFALCNSFRALLCFCVPRTAVPTLSPTHTPTPPTTTQPSVSPTLHPTPPTTLAPTTEAPSHNPTLPTFAPSQAPSSIDVTGQIIGSNVQSGIPSGNTYTPLESYWQSTGYLSGGITFSGVSGEFQIPFDGHYLMVAQTSITASSDVVSIGLSFQVNAQQSSSLNAQSAAAAIQNYPTILNVPYAGYILGGLSIAAAVTRGDGSSASTVISPNGLFAIAMLDCTLGFGSVSSQASSQQAIQANTNTILTSAYWGSSSIGTLVYSNGQFTSSSAGTKLYLMVMGFKWGVSVNWGDSSSQRSMSFILGNGIGYRSVINQAAYTLSSTLTPMYTSISGIHLLPASTTIVGQVFLNNGGVGQDSGEDSSQTFTVQELNIGLPYGIVYNSGSSQAINNGTWTTINSNWGSATVANGMAFNNGIFTIPSLAGTYIIVGGASFLGVSGGVRSIRIVDVNTGTIFASGLYNNIGTTGIAIIVQAVAQLYGGEDLAIQVLQTSGVTVSMDTSSGSQFTLALVKSTGVICPTQSPTSSG